MKSNRLIITLIVILSIMCITITTGFIYLLVNGNGFNFAFDFSNKSMKLIDSYEALPDTITDISLHLYSTDIEIRESETDKILVEYYSNKDNNPTIEYTDTTIKVDESNYNVSCIGICNNRRQVVLHIPSEYYGKININTMSGDILSYIDLSSIDLKVSTTSGDLKLNIVGNIDIKTTSGDINISEVNKIMNIKTTSGDISINELNIKEDSYIKATSGDVSISNNNSKCYVEVRTNSGDQYINNSDRKSDLVLSIITTSGDVRVN